MATIVVQQHHTSLRQSPTPPPLTPALTLSTPRSPTPIPNKHIPYCPPGPIPPSSQTITPPNSPPSRSHITPFTSVLHPPNSHPKLLNSPPIYGINGSTLKSALDQLSAQPLPDPQHVFPWLHGLHPENHIQLAFFVPRKKSLRRLPRCLRSITIVKAGGDLTRARLKGAVALRRYCRYVIAVRKAFWTVTQRRAFQFATLQYRPQRWLKYLISSSTERSRPTRESSNQSRKEHPLCKGSGKNTLRR